MLMLVSKELNMLNYNKVLNTKVNLQCYLLFNTSCIFFRSLYFIVYSNFCSLPYSDNKIVLEYDNLF